MRVLRQTGLMVLAFGTLVSFGIGSSRAQIASPLPIQHPTGRWETGRIAANPSCSDKSLLLTGPIWVTSLSTGVDPTIPRQGFVIVSGPGSGFTNVWISTDYFKGPFFLPNGATMCLDRQLYPGQRGSVSEVIYSGYR